MKIFFDTNVYIAEALLGAAAEEMLAATVRASWRIYVSPYVLDELERVMTEELGISARLAALSRQRTIRRAKIVSQSVSKHEVAQDPKDTPILQAAVAAGADILVTNDRHLLDLNPYEGLRIISMTDYHALLTVEGLLADNS